MQFYPPGLVSGIIWGLISLGTLLQYETVSVRKTLGLSILVAVVTYLLPSILYEKRIHSKSWSETFLWMALSFGIAALILNWLIF